MNLISYIVLALVMGISALVAMRNSAEAHPVQLTRGIVISLILCVMFTLLMGVGMLVGDLLRFDYPSADKAVCAGLLLVVILKKLFSVKSTTISAYNIEQLSSVLLVAMALGINVLLVGIGVGFLCVLPVDLWKMAVPTMLLVFLMSMWGIMLGRKQVDIRPRRWIYLGMLGLLVVALVGIL